MKVGNYANLRRMLQIQVANGEAEAQYLLGLLYLDGVDGPKDVTTAGYLFSEAAKKGWPAAQFIFGKLKLNGAGMAVNNREGLDWILKSARGDHAEGQYVIGQVSLLTGKDTATEQVACY